MPGITRLRWPHHRSTGDDRGPPTPRLAGEGLPRGGVTSDLQCRVVPRERMCVVPKPYPKEFREEVVRVALNRRDGVRIKDIAADFGITESCLGNWPARGRPGRLAGGPSPRPARHSAGTAAADRGSQHGSAPGRPVRRLAPSTVTSPRPTSSLQTRVGSTSHRGPRLCWRREPSESQGPCAAPGILTPLSVPPQIRRAG